MFYLEDPFVIFGASGRSGQPVDTSPSKATPAMGSMWLGVTRGIMALLARSGP